MFFSSTYGIIYDRDNQYLVILQIIRVLSCNMITRAAVLPGDIMKKLITAGCGILAIGLITYFPALSSTRAMEGNESDSYEYEYYYNDSEYCEGDDMSDNTASLTEDDIATDDNLTADAFKLPDKIDTKAKSLTVLVNKEYSLPSSYVPKELVLPDVSFLGPDGNNKRYMRKEAAKALEKMFKAAGKKDKTLYGVSAYRSYTRQADIYAKNVRERGRDATNKVSSMPGHSEHQTGLAIDISCKQLNGALSERFADTAEGQWVEGNCYRYGFIIRYPKNKEDITGYSYEPWHIRYVGIPVATYIYEHRLTLEEYFNYTPDSNSDTGIISDAATAEKVTTEDSSSPKKGITDKAGQHKYEY